jgi:hypothetical protein
LIGEDVDFECLMILELIKFRFPSIYELIYMQHDLFLEENPVRATYEQYLSPRMIASEDSAKGSNEVSCFKKYIEQFPWLSVDDVSLLNGLFMTLFEESRYREPKARNSISSSLYFEIYFRFRLSDKDLSDKDFKSAMAAGNMSGYMAYCTNRGLHKKLMVRFMQEDIPIEGIASFQEIVLLSFIIM